MYYICSSVTRTARQFQRRNCLWSSGSRFDVNILWRIWIMLTMKIGSIRRFIVYSTWASWSCSCRTHFWPNVTTSEIDFQSLWTHLGQWCKIRWMLNSAVTVHCYTMTKSAITSVIVVEDTQNGNLAPLSKQVGNPSDRKVDRDSVGAEDGVRLQPDDGLVQVRRSADDVQSQPSWTPRGVTMEAALITVEERLWF